jgi:hypothetical protein
MEIVGGFMIMMGILGFFLTVIWLVMPFILFSLKGKLDRALDAMPEIEKRLSVIEAELTLQRHAQRSGEALATPESEASGTSEKGLDNSPQ